MKKLKPIHYLIMIFFLALAMRSLCYQRAFHRGSVYFFGSDSWYHMRRIAYGIANNFSFPDHDPYLHYPHGGSGYWGPLFDGFIVGAIKLLGAAQVHSQEVIAAWIPAVLGAACIFAVFILGQYFFSTTIGLLAAFFLAILPGHAEYSLLGHLDHHVAESLFFGLLFAGFFYWQKTLHPPHLASPTRGEEKSPSSPTKGEEKSMKDSLDSPTHNSSDSPRPLGERASEARVRGDKEKPSFYLSHSLIWAAGIGLFIWLFYMVHPAVTNLYIGLFWVICMLYVVSQLITKESPSPSLSTPSPRLRSISGPQGREKEAGKESPPPNLPLQGGGEKQGSLPLQGGGERGSRWYWLMFFIPACLLLIPGFKTFFNPPPGLKVWGNLPHWLMFEWYSFFQPLLLFFFASSIALACELTAGREQSRRTLKHATTTETEPTAQEPGMNALKIAGLSLITGILGAALLFPILSGISTMLFKAKPELQYTAESQPLFMPYPKGGLKPRFAFQMFTYLLLAYPIWWALITRKWWRKVFSIPPTQPPPPGGRSKTGGLPPPGGRSKTGGLPPPGGRSKTGGSPSPGGRSKKEEFLSSASFSSPLVGEARWGGDKDTYRLIPFLALSAAIFAIVMLQLKYVYIFSYAMAIALAWTAYEVWQRKNTLLRVITVAVLVGAFIPCSEWWSSLAKGSRFRYLTIADTEYEMLRGMRDHTPKTQGYLDLTEKPEYGVMAPWSMGHAIIYLAQRPVVADPFNHGMIESAGYYTAVNPIDAVKILINNGLRYVISEDMSPEFAQKIYSAYLNLPDDHPLRLGKWTELFQMRILTELPVEDENGQPSTWGHELIYRSHNGQNSLYEFKAEEVASMVPDSVKKKNVEKLYPPRLTSPARGEEKSGHAQAKIQASAKSTGAGIQPDTPPVIPAKAGIQSQVKKSQGNKGAALTPPLHSFAKASEHLRPSRERRKKEAQKNKKTEPSAAKDSPHETASKQSRTAKTKAAKKRINKSNIKPLAIPEASLGRNAGLVAEIGETGIITEKDVGDWQAAQGCYPGGLTSRKGALMRQLEATTMEEVLRVHEGMLISEEEYKKEVERIDRETRAPDILGCIKNHFSNDIKRYWRVYLRPILIAKKFHHYTANDPGVQERAFKLREKVKKRIDSKTAFTKIADEMGIDYSTHTYHSEAPKKDKEAQKNKMLPPELEYNPFEGHFIKEHFTDLAPGTAKKEPIQSNRTIEFIKLKKRKDIKYEFEKLTINKTTGKEFFDVIGKFPLKIHDTGLRDWIRSIHGNFILDNALKLE
ncbi:STT3 domain-containing protein [Elusimicrobiota bacterium]